MDDDVATGRLGKYEVRGVLGKGAMGTVHDAWDPAIARRVAIKTVRLPEGDDLEGQEALARFKREAQAAGRLTHPNIVGVYDYGETETLAFIVMEFVDGRTLKHALDAGERFPTANAVRLLDDILDGLAYSHGLGVVHRDIKPANIMLTGQGRAKIADFGIARIESSSLTQAGTVLGTPAYMSPEQFMGQVVDRRTDIYSTGVLLYQLLTGERPFEGSLTGIMHKVLNTTPPRPSELAVTAPSSLDAVVARAMARRPEDRFDTADQFSAALRDALAAPLPSSDATIVAAPRAPAPAASATTGSPAATPSPTATPARRKSRTPLLLGAGAALVIAAGAVAAFLLLPGPAQHAPAPKSAASPALPTPTPAPTATPRPMPTPTPAPTPAPVPTAGEIHAALDRSLAGIACSVVTADVTDDRAATLRGIADETGARAASAAAARAGAAHVENATTVTTGPYCDLLNVLRGPELRVAGSGQELGLVPEGGTLSDNQIIKIGTVMPPYAAYLHVAYVANDGTVSLLVPGPGYPSRRYAPGERVVFGKPSAGFPGWQVGPPYGTDLVIAIASSEKLLDHLPATEPVAAYAAALKAAIDRLASTGVSLSPAIAAIATKPK